MRVIEILKYLNESFLLIFNSLSHFHFFQLKISQKLTKKREKMRQLLLLKYVQLCTIIIFFFLIMKENKNLITFGPSEAFDNIDIFINTFFFVKTSFH